ncbi:helix-turn-helix transcriptional regulator [Actinocatenispora rupis]|uniref:ArsR family transcriptional regulator n=1 Tax=Actinocatenispora rupis TaxID=519421 RepID=A0A8J3J1S7_9ACTN|nr:hypothetical protein [Actinocatenispora rupis]GID09931.1 ArsR family transcriptional regulator [Actinocatenispora rupis]
MAADPAIRAIAALDDELRRGMYEFIRDARRPVTRDEAAAAVGISRKLAAFHLDKLVAAGVLHATFQRATGLRRVGRAPKVYEPTGGDIRVSLPPRQYDLLAGILLDAVLAAGADEGARDAAVRTARERGHEIGADHRRRTRPGRLGAERALTIATGLLESHGFAPARDSPRCVRLRNCPFHPLAERAPDTVCAINHAFLDGLLDGLDARSVTARLAPQAGECCVRLTATT